MDDPIIRPRQARRLLGIGNTTLYKLIKDGHLSAPIKISTRASGWRKSVLDAYIEMRAGRIPSGQP